MYYLSGSIQILLEDIQHPQIASLESWSKILLQNDQILARGRQSNRV